MPHLIVEATVPEKLIREYYTQANIAKLKALGVTIHKVTKLNG